MWFIVGGIWYGLVARQNELSTLDVDGLFGVSTVKGIFTKKMFTYKNIEN